MSKGRVLTKNKWGHCARYWRRYKLSAPLDFKGNPI